MSAPAVARALALLELLAGRDGQPWTLSEIARELGAPKSSTSALCAELERGGYLERADGGLRLGRATVALGGAYVRGFEPVREFARACRQDPVLREEVVQLAVLDEVRAADGARLPGVLYLARHEGTAPLRVSASVGDRLPAATTALGLVMLARLPGPEQEKAIGAIAASGDDTGGVRARLEAVWARGVAVDEGVTFEHVVGLAVAVPTALGVRPCAVGVTMLDRYAVRERRTAVEVALQALGQRLSDPAHELAGSRRAQGRERVQA